MYMYILYKCLYACIANAVMYCTCTHLLKAKQPSLNNLKDKKLFVFTYCTCNQNIVVHVHVHNVIWQSSCCWVLTIVHSPYTVKGHVYFALLTALTLTLLPPMLIMVVVFINDMTIVLIVYVHVHVHCRYMYSTHVHTYRGIVLSFLLPFDTLFFSLFSFFSFLFFFYMYMYILYLFPSSSSSSTIMMLSYQWDCTLTCH